MVVNARFLFPSTLIGVVMMPVIGRLMSKGVSPIPFVIVGFILFCGYSWLSASMSPDVGRWDFFFPLLLRALGLSMVNLPLINQAVAGLKPKEYASGIALNNMIRQLGGAFGIAMANNYIAHLYPEQWLSDFVIIEDYCLLHCLQDLFYAACIDARYNYWP